MALKRETTAKIRELLKQNPNGLNITAVVRNIRINRNTAGRYLENLMVSGQVEMRQFGMAKIYRLAQRVPLSAMLSISSELIMLLDNSQRVIYANEVLLKFLGSTQNDLYGKNIEYTSLVTIFNEAFPLLVKKVRAGLKGAEWTGELSLKDKGVIFSCRVKPAVFEEGQRGVSLILEDITERKRAEEALRDSEAKYRNLFDNAVVGFFRSSHDGRLIGANNAYAKMFGYRNPGSMIRQITSVGVQLYANPDDRNKILAALSEQGYLEPTEVQVRHRDGHLFWASVTARTIRDDKGRIIEYEGSFVDITKRKKAEEALQSVNERLRYLLASTSVAIYTSRTSGDYGATSITDNVVQMTGYEPSDFIENSSFWIDHVHPEDKNRIQDDLPKIFDSGFHSYEYRFQCKDGRYIWIIDEMRLSKDENGRPLEIIGQWMDITERKRLEKVLRESEERLRSITANSPDMILLINTRYEILFINRTITLHPEEVLGRPVLDFVPEEFRDAAVSCFEQVKKTGKQAEYSTEYQFPGGERRYYESVVGPVFQNKEVDVLVVNARDVTKRRLVEDTLRESEEKYRNLIERANDGICVIQDGVVKFCNRRITEFWGGSIHETLGRSFTDFVHPDAIPEIIDLYKRRMAGENVPSIYETKLKRKDGSIFYAEVNAGIVTYAGKPGDLIIIRDMNDRKKTEEELRRRS